MESLFRKHFWVFTATFVGLLALLAAWIASDWTGWKLAGPRAPAGRVGDRRPDGPMPPPSGTG